MPTLTSLPAAVLARADASGKNSTGSRLDRDQRTAGTALVDELSVVMPVWNEEALVERSVESALKVLPTLARRWELVVVDDGSEDSTPLILERMAAVELGLRPVLLDSHAGYWTALSAGFLDLDPYFGTCDGLRFPRRPLSQNFDLMVLAVVPQRDAGIGLFGAVHPHTFYRLRRIAFANRNVIRGFVVVIADAIEVPPLFWQSRVD